MSDKQSSQMGFEEISVQIKQTGGAIRSRNELIISFITLPPLPIKVGYYPLIEYVEYSPRGYAVFRLVLL